MHQIINFVIRYKNFLIYIFLLTFSLILTIQSHSYHQSRFFNSSHWVSGTIYKTSDNISYYFNLGKENKKLVEENQRLHHLMFNRNAIDSVKIDSTKVKYTIATAQIIKNSYANPRNYLTINKGTNDSLKPDMGVITAKGILGIVENLSNNFATVQSILNENSNINAKIKNTNHFGSLIWDTKIYNIVQLIDIPRLVPLTIGDTIVTGGMSSIFPENIPIGTIKKFDLSGSRGFYTIDISLFNDMTNLKNVYIIHNTDRQEIIQLESQTSTDDQ
ncbi:MAG: rod shape-determining protein MreC [Maribacter sp.]|nr:MAG: rod shape-determining protein MreC [Maribacter sp.]